MAILLVVAAHAVPAWLPAAGAVGVAVFFALSGFLITSLLLEQERIDLRGFYLRRAARLFPALAVFVAFMLLLQVAVAKNFGHPADAVWVALYVGNWVSANGGTMGALDHTWSLAVEEQFYILFPLLLIAASRLPRRALLALLAGGVLVSLTLRFGLLAAGSTVDRVYRGTDTTACLLLLGGCAAVALTLRSPSRSRPWLAAVAMTGIAALALKGQHIGGEKIGRAHV